MHSPLASRTLLLVPDSRQTALAAFAVAGLDQAAYSAYGHQSRTPAFRMGFNGQLREAPGWYLLGNGHRVYNPVLMRFHSADRLSPFGKGGLNAYAYCEGDPINCTDPTGQFVDWLVQNPLHSMTLNIGLTILNTLALFLPTPAGLPFSVVASMIGIGGGTLGAMGDGLQVAGIKEGRHVSVIGTFVSIAGMTVKVGLSARVIFQDPAKAVFNFKNNLHKIRLGKAPKPLKETLSAQTGKRITKEQELARLSREIKESPPRLANGANGANGANKSFEKSEDFFSRNTEIRQAVRKPQQGNIEGDSSSR